MESYKLKYINYDIVFQEVPNEISLAINVTGCLHRCEGCHSNYLWDYVGSFIDDDIDKLINKYRNMITCVCFMGGDQNIYNLKHLLQKVKYQYGLKTCLYSGSNNIDTFKDIIDYLDYLKVGSYIEKYGGLKSKTTNQKFYQIENGRLIDNTYCFNKNIGYEG